MVVYGTVVNGVIIPDQPLPEGALVTLEPAIDEEKEDIAPTFILGKTEDLTEQRSRESPSPE